MKYLTRIVDNVIARKLRTAGALLIQGPKWCGKTKTGQYNSKSEVLLMDPDNAASYEKMIDTKPSLILEGDTPRLLDEWQVYPVLWDAVRFACDKRGEMGQFILTGSSSPKFEDYKPKHTGTGRFARIMMRPMSLFESLESSGEVSLGDLFDGKQDIYAASSVSIEDLAFYIVRGGWPQAIGIEDKNDAIDIAKNYVDGVIDIDVNNVDGVKKDPQKMRLLMKSFARNISTMATQKTLEGDVKASSGIISENTVSSYINALERIFVIENTPAWNTSLRSKTAIRTASKLQFVDPSIAAAILDLSPRKLLQDFQYFGFLFESLCNRDLKVYAESLGGMVYHYHDKNNLEADAVIVLNDGRWAAVEIKLGKKEIEEGAAHLLKLAAITVEKPAFLMILTGTEFAYKRDDGVFVVPIGVLKN